MTTKNGDMPSMPANETISCGDMSMTEPAHLGLTKREIMAMHAMQGILAGCAGEEIGYTDWDKSLAKHSIKVADALLKELEG